MINIKIKIYLVIIFIFFSCFTGLISAKDVCIGNQYGEICVYPKIDRGATIHKQFFNLTVYGDYDIDVAFVFNETQKPISGGIWYKNAQGNYTKLNHEYHNLNGKHAYVFSVTLNAYQMYQGYYKYIQPINTSGKWDMYIKLQTDTWQNYRIHLDPWWNSSYLYRRTLNIDNAINDYQMLINVTYNSGGDVNCSGNCQTDFDDIRFTDIDNTTILSYWIERQVNSDYAWFWVRTPIDIETDNKINMYYGNNAVNNISNGTNTFYVFLDYHNTTGWTLSNIVVSNASYWLRFYNGVIANKGVAYRTDLSVGNDEFVLEYLFYGVSLGTVDQTYFLAIDGDTTIRYAQNMIPYLANGQNDWMYYDGGVKYILQNTYVEGDLYINKIQIDQSDSATGIDYFALDKYRTVINSVVSENFALGAPTVFDGVHFGDSSTSINMDLRIKWLFCRNFTTGTEPSWNITGLPKFYCGSFSVVNESPVNNSLTVPVTFDNCTININQTYGLNFNVSIDFVNGTNPNIYQNFTNVGNGTYYNNISSIGLLDGLVSYTWFVNVSLYNNDTLLNSSYYYNFTTSSSCPSNCELYALIILNQNELNTLNDNLEMCIGLILLFFVLIIGCIFAINSRKEKQEKK